MRLGLSYQMNDKVQLCLEAEKNIDAKASIKMGMDYQALDPLFVRCGIQTNPTILTFGFGLQWKSFMLDFSTTQHAVLGYSPNLGWYIPLEDIQIVIVLMKEGASKN